MGVLNLEEQLVFYGAYHSHPGNVAIHMVCVPGIMATAFLWGTNTPALLDIPYLPLNLGGIAALTYSLLYILMEPVAGALVTPLILAGTAYGNHLVKSYGSTANWWAGYIDVACWIVQFIGHGVYEKRAPALLDNLVQAFFLAPFFVWFEVLFACGYRPELKNRIQEKVQVELRKFKESKKGGGEEVPLETLDKGGKKTNGVVVG